MAEATAVKQRPVGIDQMPVGDFAEEYPEWSRYLRHLPSNWVVYLLVLECGHGLILGPSLPDVPTAPHLGNQRWACGICMADAIREKALKEEQ